MSKTKLLIAETVVELLKTAKEQRDLLEAALAELKAYRQDLAARHSQHTGYDAQAGEHDHVTEAPTRCWHTGYDGKLHNGTLATCGLCTAYKPVPWK